MTLVAPAPLAQTAYSPFTRSLLATLWRRWRARRIRLALHDLCDRQLRDIGLDPASVRPSGPVMSAPAGLISNLTAMR